MAYRPPLGEVPNGHNSIAPSLNPNGKRLLDDVDPAHASIGLINFHPPPSDGPAAVRRKINRYIENSGTKVGDFQREIGVNSNGFNTFMRHKGDKGEGSNTFHNARAFFWEMERRGEKIPTKKSSKKQKTAVAVGEGSRSAVDGKLAQKEAVDKFDVSNICLEGEEEENVPIYDTCDEVRRKIAAHLREPGVTQAGFCRTVAAQFPDKDTKVPVSSLQSFRGNNGANAGGQSKVFYGAYVFFEKLRVKKGKAKSKHSETMEEIWPGGFSRKGNSRSGYIVRTGMHVYEDKWGVISTGY